MNRSKVVTTKKERRSATETKKNSKNSNLFETLPSLVLISSPQAKMSSPPLPTATTTTTNGSVHEPDLTTSIYDTIKPTSVEINSQPSLNGNSNGNFENNTDNSTQSPSPSKHVLKLKVGGNDESNSSEKATTTNGVNGHHITPPDSIESPLEPLIVREMPKESYNSNNIVEDLVFGTSPATTTTATANVSNGDGENENNVTSTMLNPSSQNVNTDEIDHSNNNKNLGPNTSNDLGSDSGLASSSATSTPSILPSDDDTSGSSISSVKLNQSTLKNINENDSSAMSDTASITSSKTITDDTVEDHKTYVDEPKSDVDQSYGGVFQPEPSSVKDTVKVFEAALAAGSEQLPPSSTAQGKKASTMKTSSTIKDRPNTKSSNSFSSSDKTKLSKEQISPLGSSVGSSESFDTTSVASSSSATTTTPTIPVQQEQKEVKSKPSKKRPSLKKQIQHLLKIDKSSPSQNDDSHKQENVIQEEPITSSPSMTTTANKKANTLNSRNNKTDKRDKNGTDVNETKVHISPLHSPDSLNEKFDKDLSSMLTDEQKANVFKKRPSPPASSLQQQKRTSPRESVEKTQTTTTAKTTEFNMHSPTSKTIEPLEIRISNDPIFTKKKSVSPSSKLKTGGLLQQNDAVTSDKVTVTNESDGRRSGVSKLISSFQTLNNNNNNQHDNDGIDNGELEQTILVPRLQRLSTSPDKSQSQFDTTSASTPPPPPPPSTTKMMPSDSHLSSGLSRSVQIDSGRRLTDDSIISTNDIRRTPTPRIQQQNDSTSFTSSTQSILQKRSATSNTQVTADLRDRHIREKNELNDLNQRFSGYVATVKSLEHYNAKLTKQLDEITKSWGLQSQQVVQIHTPLLDRLRHDVNDNMLDEADWETRLRRSHYTIDNYRQLINDETQWNDKQEAKRASLKAEYDNSCIELTNLQKSYKQVEEQLKNLLKHREDLLQDIENLNEQSYKTTMDRIRLDLQVQTLREEIPFLNDIHSHLISEFDQLKPTTAIDTQSFYRQELEKAIRDIRKDFQEQHNIQRAQMEERYKVKIEEIHNEMNNVAPLQERMGALNKIKEEIKMTQNDITDASKILAREKETYKGLQDKFLKMEEDLKYNREKQFGINDAVNKDLMAVQNRIQILSQEIERIETSNVTLEQEIAVYRRLIESETNRLPPPPIEPPTPEPLQVIGSELGRVFNRIIKKGPISIKECAPSGKFIILENASTDKDVDVSNWVIRRRVDGNPDIQYVIPYGLTIKRGKELKIYARNAQGYQRPPYEIINDKIDSWGMGIDMETKVYNEQNEEKAAHSQKLVFGPDTSRDLS